MSALSEALVAAQHRALASLEKAYMVGTLDDPAAAVGELTFAEHVAQLGLNDPVDVGHLQTCLDTIRTYGGSVPTETNGAKSDPATEPMSDKQRGFIEQLCREKQAELPDDFDTLTKAQASETINQLSQNHQGIRVDLRRRRHPERTALGGKSHDEHIAASGRCDKIRAGSRACPEGLGAASVAPAPAIAGWRWYLGLGIFLGYAAGALTIGGFWWWGW